jgi:hypothetical protein
MAKRISRAGTLTVIHTYRVPLDANEMARYDDGMLDVTDYYDDNDLENVEVYSIEYED